MSTAIGQRMMGAGSRGCGVKYHSTGSGIVRNIASSVVGSLGRALVNKLEGAIKGNGFKLSGGKKKKHVGRPRKVGRPKKR